MATVYQLPLPDPDTVDGFHSMLNRSTPHRGVDFPAPGGTPFRAIADGTVVLLEYSSQLGWVTVLKHSRSAAEVLRRLRPVYSGYCHQDIRASLWVGERVRRGAVIGRVGFRGHNGSSAQGEHLHLTMSHDPRGVFAGEVFDPLGFIAAHAPRASKRPAPPSSYVVRPGDTLWDIANTHGRTVAELVEKNRIKDPALIYPGQRIRL